MRPASPTSAEAATSWPMRCGGGGASEPSTSSTSSTAKVSASSSTPARRLRASSGRSTYCWWCVVRSCRFDWTTGRGIRSVELPGEGQFKPGATHFSVVRWPQVRAQTVDTADKPSWRMPLLCLSGGVTQAQRCRQRHYPKTIVGPVGARREPTFVVRYTGPASLQQPAGQADELPAGIAAANFEPHDRSHPPGR